MYNRLLLSWIAKSWAHAFVYVTSSFPFSQCHLVHVHLPKIHNEPLICYNVALTIVVAIVLTITILRRRHDNNVSDHSKFFGVV